MRKTWILLGAAIASAGCGGGDRSPAVATAASPSVAVTSQLAATASATTDPTAAPPAPAGSPSESQPAEEPVETTAFGETIKTPRGSLMTVYGTTTPGRRTAPAPAGTHWLSVDVKFCVTASLKSRVPITQIRGEFTIELEDGSTERPDGKSAAAGERFSDEALLVGAGDCVRGPVVFAIPDDVRPANFVLVTPLGNRQWPISS